MKERFSYYKGWVPEPCWDKKISELEHLSQAEHGGQQLVAPMVLTEPPRDYREAGAALAAPAIPPELPPRDY